MPKFYETKPCQIVAEQWTGKNIEEIIEFVGNDASFDYSKEKPILTIKTLEGDMKASVDDYIIKGLRGEFYPCKPDVFEKKYEKTDAKGSLGTLYELNKQASSTEKIMTNQEIRKKLIEIETYVINKKDSYFMLLNKENSDYTLFNIKDKKYSSLKQDLKECLINRGKIVSMHLTKDKVYEIWLRIKNQKNREEDIVYYFFPYDLGVIES